MNKKEVYTVEEIKRKMERYCVYQDRCHKEVENKLREYKLIQVAKEAILLHLLEHDFLNEQRFSKSFARGKYRIKKWGRLRISRELKIRNISDYNIKTALKEIDNELYMSNLFHLTKNKNELIKDQNIYERRRKLYTYLNYRGYELNLINQVINQVIK
ncbi:recombinase RecX [Tenacibaculum sp. SZ-18]|uniref:regulatory protein RecX n=1 Tax=Tenacibaculum sp. SZ-18 TaxID=754423 RepID=UPI000C2D10C8|nr:regulatory protein RecX [Tenacibaculum sp. SZ-18]AUC13660.1 recombinase RecX [Tenacibaculum sp. SZ-18]